MNEQQTCTHCGADAQEVQHRIKNADRTFWHRYEWQHAADKTPANAECQSPANADGTS